MSYRDDVDALAARHATLLAEVGHRKRELTEVAAMLAEARRVEQAESYFERAPDLRRRRRGRLAIAAVVGLMITGGVLGAAVAAAAHRTEVVPELRPMAIRSRADIRISYGELDRMRAQVEALNVLGLIPVVPPSPGAQPAPAAPAAQPASVAREHKR